MAPWVACYDWGKGSALATSLAVVAVGPASKWNGSGVLRGHVEDMMSAAGAALNTQAREATGVELGFAAADEWLVAKLANPALERRVLLAQSAEEYQELMRLMSEDGCKWVQVGTCDWGEDSGLVKDSAWDEALLLAYSPDGSVMSDVVEAPASDGAGGDGMGFVARLHGIEGPVVVRPEAGEPARRKLFVGLTGSKVDDMEAVLGKAGKWKTPPRRMGVLDRDDDIDIGDDTDMEDVVPPLMSRPRGGRACGSECLDRIDGLEKALGRVEDMVRMLVALGGLAGPAERLEVEKRKGRMAREWDESIAKAGERAKAEAAVKAADKRMKKKELDDARAEDARLRQEGIVKVKEAARAAAEAERDRLVTEVKGCAEGPDAVAAAEKVVEAARMVVELEREVAASAAPVEIGGWQVAGGRKRKTVQVVSQLCRPLDRERRESLQGAVSKVQGLIGAASLGWGVVASPYTVHGGDEVLWTVRGVDEVTNGSEVAKVVSKNLEAVWGVGSLIGCWVENKMSAYVVVRGIPEREWLSDKGGVQGLVDGNPGIMWGPRQPTVTGRAWNRVDVKVEIMTAEAAKSTVVRGLVYCGTRRTVHMAVGGGGANVPRQGLLPSTVGIGAKRSVATPAAGYGPLRGSRVSTRTVGACFQCKRNGHWKNECPDGPRVVERGCFTCGLLGHISRFCPKRAVTSVGREGAVKGKQRGEHGPQQKRMGPNERGWQEQNWLAQVNAIGFDYSKSVDETMRERGASRGEGVQKATEGIEKSGGPSGARS